MPIGCGHHSPKILGQHRQSAFDFQESFGLRERVAVSQAGPNEFTGHPGRCTGNATGAFGKMVRVQMGTPVS